MLRNLKTAPREAERGAPLLAGLLAATPQTRLAQFAHTKDAEIYGEGEPADYVYQVIAGAVRVHKLLSDGRRQIGAFYLPDDLFGVESGPTYRFTAEAIVDTVVRMAKRSSLEAVVSTDIRVVRDLLTITAGNLRHAEDHMLLLGRKTSMERVAAFLLEMDSRLTRAGMLALPMCRRDIADYLGLTLETVSRALSQLQDEGVIRFTGCHQRDIVLQDPRRLREMDS